MVDWSNFNAKRFLTLIDIQKRIAGQQNSRQSGPGRDVLINFRILTRQLLSISRHERDRVKDRGIFRDLTVSRFKGPASLGLLVTHRARL